MMNLAMNFDTDECLVTAMFDKGNSSLNGRELHKILRREFHLEMEMEAENYVLALAAVGDTAEGFERLCDKGSHSPEEAPAPLLLFQRGMDLRLSGAPHEDPAVPPQEVPD